MQIPLSSVVLPAQQVEAAPLTTDDLKAYASTTAKEDGLNVSHFLATINCESQWNPNATSSTADYGIVQIHAAAHPEITMQEMLDPLWSIQWMGKEWQEGNESAWTCWRDNFSI